MKAIIIKELRENLRWAVGLVVSVSLVLTWGINDGLQGWQAPAIASWPIYYATIGSFSGAGLILGLLQSLQDQWRGRRAFVMHRPAAASSIFWGKVLAGLSLYLLITAIPLLAMLVWAAAPGNLPAPFDWHMALPCMWDLLNGISWYFTGILIGSRPARWLGSRIMPLGTVLLCTYFGIDQSPNVFESLLAIAVALLIVVPAAWGSFIYGGSFERQPAIIRGLQTVGVTLGLGTVLLLGLDTAVEFLRTMDRPAMTRFIYFTYRIDNVGRVVRSEMESGGQSMHDADPNGNPIEPATAAQMGRVGIVVEQLSTIRGSSDDGRGHEHRFHSPERYLEVVYSDRSRAHQLVLRSGSWNYRSIRLSYSPAYRERRPRRVCAAEQPAEPFPLPVKFFSSSDPSWIKIFHDGTHVYQIDFGGRREITQLPTTTMGDPIIDISSLHMSDGYRIVLAKKSFRVLRDGREILHVPMELDSRYILVARQEDGSFTLLCSPGRVWKTDSRYRMITISADGQTVGQTELPSLPDGKVVGPIQSRPFWERLLPLVGMSPGWVVFRILYYKIVYGTGQFIQELFWPTVITLVAMVSGGTAFWLARRYAFTRASQIVWACFAALIGLPGLAALVAMRNWPARIKCPSCGNPRVVTHESCEHCNAPFAPPRAIGIEIFE